MDIKEINLDMLVCAWWQKLSLWAENNRPGWRGDCQSAERQLGFLIECRFFQNSTVAVSWCGKARSRLLRVFIFIIYLH
jgi:hypothetical protein